MEAHKVKEEKYLVILSLCLDSVDGQWLKDWKEEYKNNWKYLSKAFIAHFQHPNAMVIWQDQIHSLKMDNTIGVQRYTDQFVKLARRIRWDLDGEVAIYQYKKGLPNWLIDSLTASKAAMVNQPGVSQLSIIALKIEANRRVKVVEKTPYSSPRQKGNIHKKW